MPARIIAGSLSLIAFAVAVLAGLAASNPAPTILGVAVVVMIAFYFIGLLVGTVAHRAVTEQIEAYKAAHPIRQADDAGQMAGDTAVEPDATRSVRQDAA